MADLISVVQHANLVDSKNKRGDTLFSFEAAFLRELEKEVAEHIQEETGHQVAAFVENEPRKAITKSDFFSPKTPAQLRDGFSKRLLASVGEMIAFLNQQSVKDGVSYKVGINFCVSCGEWNDQALVDLEWRPVVRSF